MATPSADALRFDPVWR